MNYKLSWAVVIIKLSFSDICTGFYPCPYQNGVKPVCVWVCEFYELRELHWLRPHRTTVWEHAWVGSLLRCNRSTSLSQCFLVSRFLSCLYSLNTTVLMFIFLLFYRSTVLLSSSVWAEGTKPKHNKLTNRGNCHKCAYLVAGFYICVWECIWFWTFRLRVEKSPLFFASKIVVITWI